MSRISVKQPHSKPVDEVESMVKTLADNLSEHYDLKASWSGDRRVEFERHGVSGFLRFDEREVEVELKLGLMARPFKGKIRTELERALTKYLV